MMLSKQQRALIADFNTKNFKKPRFKNAILLFETQVRKSPKKIAVEFGKEKLTYEELNQKANTLASFLTRFLNKNQQKIYILADKGIDIIVVFLGILKSGNILIPINPQYPLEMIMAMFKEIKPDFIIIQQKYFNLLKKMDKNLAGINVLIIDGDLKISYPKANFKLLILDSVSQFSGKAQAKKLSKTKENKYAYIYFTSGSTGRPKAVIATNLTLSFSAEVLFKKYSKNNFRNFRVGQITSIYMHLSLGKDILPTLCYGATLCIPRNENILFSVSELIKWLKENRITLVGFPPGNIFRYFLQEIKNVSQLKYLKYIFVYGEKLVNDKYLKSFFDKVGSRIKLVNGYGTTEAPVGLQYEISKADLKKDIIPIGKSIGAKAIILNDEREVQLPGQVGEIYLHSPYLSAGYYNNPVLTKKVFIQNPFSRDPKDIIYRTGDLGRLLADGYIEFLGRSDSQVRIRGWRVELGEVEMKILAHSKVKNCVVLAKRNKKRENYLVAYYIAAGHPNLRTYLKTLLPDYMIPSFFIQLDKLPLNPSGKIDYLALPEPDKAQLAGPTKYRPPTTELEKKLVKIWQEVLGIKKIGINDNFFDLGGHSLKIVKVNSKLKELLDINLPAVMMFKYSTIKSLASHLINDGKLIDENTYNKYHTKSLKNNNLLSRSVRLLRKNSISL